MQIQRLQTLFLLIAVVLMTLTLFTPVATQDIANALGAQITTNWFITHFDGWMIINILISVLLFLAIFMFKSLKRQKLVTLVSILLICASMATGIFIIYGRIENGAIEWFGAMLIMVCALIFAIMAYARMRHDEKLLRDADRLR